MELESKEKRHRRTKAEMKLVRNIEDVKNDDNGIEYKSKKIKHSNDLVKLKFDYNGIPKDTILEVIETPKNEIYDNFYIWIKYKETTYKILKFYVFFVR